MKQTDADIMFGEMIAAIVFLTTFYMLKYSTTFSLEKVFLVSLCIFLLVSLFVVKISTNKNQRDNYESQQSLKTRKIPIANVF